MPRIQNKHVYHGGVLQRQRNPKLSSWQAVYKMINLPDAKLSRISYSSLTGFIFRLDVPSIESNTEFYGLNDKKSALTKPIYSIVFKLAIISDDDYDRLNPLIITEKNAAFDKKTENLRDFKNEANTQQQIYIDTLSPNGNPITLSIIDFSHFDKRSARILLMELNKKHTSRTISEMLRYIGLNCLDSSKNRRLGMITMELAEPTYTELADLPIRSDEYISGCQYAIAQTIILFLKSKKLNFDCHAGNVLASTAPSNPGTVLIDFGRVLDFNKDIYENIKGYYNQLTGHDYDVDLDTYKKYTVTDLYISRTNQLGTVVNNMINIMRFLTYMDYIINSISFKMKGSYDRPQLITLLQYLYGPSFRSYWGWNDGNYVAPDWTLTQDIFDRYASIIPIIRTLTEARIEQTSYVSEAAIKRRVANGDIVIFNENVNNYDRSNTITIQSIDMPTRTTETMDREGRSSAVPTRMPAPYDDDAMTTEEESCWGKWCGKKEKKEGGRKTYRKNKSRVVHKKINTTRKKYNKQKRSNKQKRD